MTKILIVDDIDQNLYMLQVLLEGHGYEVVSAGNGVEALEKARTDPPGMIVSDILMPVMDGFTLCREWKKDDQLKRIPFIFYTATYTDPKDEELALSLGAERFIAKPVEPDMFMRMLQEVIEEYEAGRLITPREPVEEETVHFRRYSEALIRKLEDKMVQLEEANRALELDIVERKRVESALSIERDNLVNILNSMEDGVYIVNQQYDIQYVNPVLVKDFGSFEGRKCYEYLHDREEVCPWCKNQDVFAGKTVRWEWYSSKNQRTYDLIDTLLKNPDGSMSKLEIFRDITERKQMEEELIRVNRALLALSECNQAVIRATEESHLLHEICQLIVEVGDYRLAWVGFAEQDEMKTVRPVAQAGFEEGYLDKLGITWADTERGRGPTGIAIRTREPAFSRDILTDPGFSLWRAEAIKRGYASSIALPLTASGRTFGVLNVYAVEPDAFDYKEVKLLMELADDLTYGIMALRTRAEREHAEWTLSERVKELTCLYKVHREMQEQLHIDELCQRIVDHLVPAMQFPEIAVSMIELDNQRFTSERYTEGLSHGLHAEIRLEGETRGHLWVYYVEDRPFSIPEEQEFLNSLTEALGVWLERKRTEEELRASEERFDLAAKGSNDGLWDRDVTTDKEWWSPRYYELLGYEDGEFKVTFEKYKELLHPEDRDRALKAEKDHLEKRVPFDIQYRLLTKSGEYRCFRARAQALWDENDNPIRIAGSIQDVTELVKYRIELESLVQERTSELEDALEDLKDLDRLKTEFLSTAAHELRTPLTSIRGFSEIMLTRELDETRKKRYLTFISQEATQLGDIIDDLLDVSRLEAIRGLALKQEPIDMTKLIDEVLTLFIESSPNHNFQIKCTTELPLMRGDSFRLSQVVKNLLSNAVKFSPKGGTITIRSQVIPGHLEISVQDEGIGMTPEQQVHLFEKFYRADASNTSISGTGLGLAVSKLIVELHGGETWAESEYGVGSTFYVKLPLAEG